MQQTPEVRAARSRVAAYMAYDYDDYDDYADADARCDSCGLNRCDCLDSCDACGCAIEPDPTGLCGACWEIGVAAYYDDT